MSLLGRLNKEVGQLKKDLNEMKDTLQRLKAYSPQVILAIDRQIEILLARKNLHENLKRKFGEARNSLANAQATGARLQGAANRQSVLNLVIEHYKDAAKSIGEAASML